MQTTCKGLANRLGEGAGQATRAGGSIPDYWRRAPAYIRALAAARQCARAHLRSPASPARFGPTCANFGQMPKKTSLAAHGISCQRGGRLLFEGLSFALQPGDGLLVTGPNGAGKDEPVAADRRAPAAAGGQHRRRGWVGPAP